MLPQLNKDQKIIFYKILNNVLVFFLFILAGALLVETFIPGFVSAYLSFTKIIFTISLIILAIFTLTKDFRLPEVKNKKGLSTEILLLFLVLPTVILASINFSLSVIITVTLSYLLILAYFYKNLLVK